MNMKKEDNAHSMEKIYFREVITEVISIFTQGYLSFLPWLLMTDPKEEQFITLLFL